MEENQEAAVDSGEGGVTETVVDSSTSDGGGKDETEKAVLEAELAKVKEERDNYKAGLLSQKRQSRQQAVQNEVSVDDEDAPVTKRDLEKVIQVVSGNKVKETINSLVKDPKKREIVEHYYDTRFSQMGTSDEQIRSSVQDAIDLIDSKINKQKAVELTRKTNMQISPNLSGSSSEPAPQSKNHKFSDQQVAELTKRAKSLGMEPTKFIEQTWRNQSRG